MGLVRRFCLGQIPAYVDGALNIVDVRDVAKGHLLADAKGEVGERYILGGRNFTFDRLFADLARISGVAPPPLKLPRSVARRPAPRSAARLGLPVRRARRTRSARRRCGGPTATRRPRSELGFEPRPHEETLEDAVELAARRSSATGAARRAAPRAVGAAGDRPRRVRAVSG